MKRILLLLSLFAATASASTNLPGPINRSSGGSQCMNVNVAGTQTNAICANATGPATFPLGLSQNVCPESSTPYTILSTDGCGTLPITTGASTFNVTLPSAANNAGRTITIKKVDSGAGTVVITPASGTIDGASTNTLNAQYSYETIQSDGTNWQSLGAWDMLGSVVSGTGGQTYSTHTTTNFSTGAVTLASVSLNIGVYLISGIATTTPSASGISFGVQFEIGGTNISQPGTNFTTSNTDAFSLVLPATPIIITANSTAVSILGSLGAGSGSSGSNVIYAVRIQ